MPARDIIYRVRDVSSSSLDAIVVRPYLSIFGDEVHRRFAIVGNARTGSNYLLDGLKTSKSIRMYHEIFGGHNREIGKDFDRIFATLFHKESRGTRVVGFKLFYNHLSEQEWEKFLAHQEFKIIHLTRRNRLRTVVSLDIAFKTGQWTSKRSDRRQDRVIYLDPADLLRRLERIRDDEVLARRRFSNHTVLEVVYEEIARNPHETFEHVGAYLGLDDIDPTRIRIRQQNPEPLSRLVRNYEEVCSLLKGTGFESYLDE